MLEQVRPDSLRAGISAPGTSDRARHEEEPERRHDQQAGDIVEFVRPDLDAEHVETAIGQIDQHCLVGSIRTAIPTNPGRAVIDRQSDEHHEPLEPAEGSVDPLVVDLGAFLEQLSRQRLTRRLVWLVTQRRRFRLGYCARNRLVRLRPPVLDNYRPVTLLAFAARRSARRAAGITVLHRPPPWDLRRPRRIPRRHPETRHRPRAS